MAKIFKYLILVNTFLGIVIFHKRLPRLKNASVGDRCFVSFSESARESEIILQTASLCINITYERFILIGREFGSV